MRKKTKREEAGCSCPTEPRVIRKYETSNCEGGCCPGYDILYQCNDCKTIWVEEV